MADQQQINQLIHKLSERTGTPEAQIKSAVERSDCSRLLSRMDPAQAKQIEELLGDEQRAQQFLNTPQAKAILRKLTG